MIISPNLTPVWSQAAFVHLPPSSNHVNFKGFPAQQKDFKENQRTQRQTWSRPFEHNKALWATKIRSASIREQPWKPSFEATKTAAVTAVKKCRGKIWKGSTKKGIQQLRKWRLKGTFDEAGWNHKNFSWYFVSLILLGTKKWPFFMKQVDTVVRKTKKMNDVV